MFCSHGFWLIGWPHIVTVVVAIVGAVGTAIRGYFLLHGDVRNPGGTPLSTRQQWQHIFGLLAYFFLGFVVVGGSCLVAFRITHAL